MKIAVFVSLFFSILAQAVPAQAQVLQPNTSITNCTTKLSGRPTRFNYLANWNCGVKQTVNRSIRRLEEIDRSTRQIYGTPTRADELYYQGYREQTNDNCVVNNGRIYCR